MASKAFLHVGYVELAHGNFEVGGVNADVTRSAEARTGSFLLGTFGIEEQQYMVVLLLLSSTKKMVE